MLEDYFEYFIGSGHSSDGIAALAFAFIEG
jgi:hypothetical protein